MDYFDFLRALVSLAVTLGLLLLLAHAYKRWGKGLKLPNGTTSRLTVLETKRLGAQTTLHLIQLDNTEQLISTTATSTTVLHTQTIAQPVAKKKS